MAGQRVYLKSNPFHTGEAQFSVPGNGSNGPWWNVRWDNGTETVERECDLGLEEAITTRLG